MRKTATLSLSAGLVAAALALSAAGRVDAQEEGSKVEKPFGADESWYYDPAPPRKPTYTVAQQKSMARGQQRMARIEIAKWNGYSPSRPTHTGGTFTTIHNPTWGWSVGRPFGWYIPRRSVVVFVR